MKVCLDFGDGVKLKHTAADYPVIEWGSYTYWPLSYNDNRYSMGIVAVHTRTAEVVHFWEVKGTRYIREIDIDAEKKTVTFHGQGETMFSASWSFFQIPTNSNKK